jgi:hypothetical protein
MTTSQPREIRSKNDEEGRQFPRKMVTEPIGIEAIGIDKVLVGRETTLWVES